MHVAEFARDRQVVSQDSAGNDVHFVVRGRVRVTIFAAGGQEVAFRDLGAGKSFGELSAIDGQARSASVVALEPSWTRPCRATASGPCCASIRR